MGVHLQTCIGVDTGAVVAGDPLRASRSSWRRGQHRRAARAGGRSGEILIGEDTYGLTRDAIEVEPVDPLALKGKTKAVGAYRLLSVRPGVAGHERRLDSPMVGAIAAADAARCVRGSDHRGGGHLFTVTGPAGIGKSRLVREFVSTIAGRAHALSGRCLSYGEGITFWPIAEMAFQAAGISEDDPPQQARAELRELLEGTPDGETVAAHLAGLLGLDGSGPVEPPWAVRRFLEALGRRRPVVAVFDDIHWGEPTLLEVIEHVAAWSRDVPILLVCMARPELLEERPAWGGGQRNATSVHLEPLSEPEADALIENLLGHPALTPEIRERIRSAANGIRCSSRRCCRCSWTTRSSSRRTASGSRRSTSPRCRSRRRSRPAGLAPRPALGGRATGRRGRGHRGRAVRSVGGRSARPFRERRPPG